MSKSKQTKRQGKSKKLACARWIDRYSCASNSNPMKQILIYGIIALTTFATKAAQLELNKGDHVVLIGNTLAERMQHHGWLESYVQAALPKHELVFRNHGFSGDKVNSRPRNRGFIAPHDYLKISKADVIIAFWGYNESYDNNPDKFKGELIKWIDETKKQNYSG